MRESKTLLRTLSSIFIQPFVVTIEERMTRIRVAKKHQGWRCWPRPSKPGAMTGKRGVLPIMWATLR
jgi:hypothetical protein